MTLWSVSNVCQEHVEHIVIRLAPLEEPQIGALVHIVD